jgi:hypothetical protein
MDLGWLPGFVEFQSPRVVIKVVTNLLEFVSTIFDKNIRPPA